MAGRAGANNHIHMMDTLALIGQGTRTQCTWLGGILAPTGIDYRCDVVRDYAELGGNLEIGYRCDVVSDYAELGDIV